MDRVRRITGNWLPISIAPNGCDLEVNRVALNRHNLDTLTQDRSQLSIAEFVNVCPVVAGLDHLRRLAFEPVGDLLKCPALAINQRISNTRCEWRADL
jgi:hypothetical protein